jgi:hypothetical protein
MIPWPIPAVALLICLLRFWKLTCDLFWEKEHERLLCNSALRAPHSKLK